MSNCLLQVKYLIRCCTTFYLIKTATYLFKSEEQLVLFDSGEYRISRWEGGGGGVNLLFGQFLPESCMKIKEN